MRRLLSLFAVSAALAAAPCHAAPPSRDSVEALLSVVDMQKTYDGTFETMRKSMDKAFAGMPQMQSLTPEQHRRFDVAMSRMMTVMHDEMDWNKLKPEFVQMYMETFSQEDVDGLLAFYRSPAGKAMLEKMPLLMSKMMQMTQTRMQTLMPRVMATVQQAMQEPGEAPAKAP